MTLVTFATALATAHVASAAESPSDVSPEPSWGRRGQLVLPNLLGYSFANGPSVAPSSPVDAGPTGIFGYAHGHADGEYNSSMQSTTQAFAVTDTIWFNPAVDWFVADRVSVGLSLLVGNRHYRFDAPGVGGWESNAFFVGGGARVGYAVPLTRELALWPRLGGNYSYMQIGDSPTGSFVFEAAADLPLVVRAGRHLYASVGPRARLAVAEDTGILRGDIDSRRASGLSIGGAFDVGLTF